MDKQKEIEELASLMADCNTTCDKCFEKLESVMTLPIQKRENYCQVYAYAQRAVEQGYRNTFTSDLASDTQKAFKDGYSKGVDYGIEFGKVLLYKTRKETAKAILNEILFVESVEGWEENEQLVKFSNKIVDKIEELAKKYGVEVEECGVEEKE